MENIQHEIIGNDDKPSKTRRKQAMLALQKVGEQLVTLNDQQLEALNLPAQLLEAILEARHISKNGARRRQMQYIGKLMRHVDMLPIQEKLEAWQQVALNQTALLHQTEQWRERILTDSAALTEFANQYPTADITRIRLLARNALKERKANKPPKNYRQLFQLLHAVILQSQNY